jgi:adenylate cyclase
VSGKVREELGDKLTLIFADLGEQQVKNIAKPVKVFRVLLDGTAAPRGTRRIPRRYWRGGVLSLAGLAIIVATIVLVQNLSIKPPHTHASIPPQEKPSLPLPSIPSIAVLPFTNQSGDPQQDYFSDGIAGQLINDLSRVPNLFVIARNSSFSYKGKGTKEQEIGKELGVRYVLEGTVRKAADQVRIGVELVDASSGTEEWTARYDRPLKDIFAVQDEIVGKVVTTLGLILKLDEMKLPHGGGAPLTDNLVAYDDHLRGVEYFFRGTKEDNASARQWEEKAIELDPKFSDAYSLLGYIYWFAVWSHWSENPQADLGRSAELAHKTLALDDSNSDALGLLSHVDWLQRRFDQAVTDARRAVAISPNDAGGYLALSTAYTSAVKPEEALRAAEQAMRLDPASRDYYANMVGIAYDEMGRYQEAVPVLKRNLASYPNQLDAHLSLIVAYAELGRDQDARAEAAEVLRISPQFTLLPPENGVFKDTRWAARVYNDLHKAGLK